MYCKDSNRRRSHEHERFTFLGYTFGPRLATGARGHFVSFSPAVSDQACKAVRATIREWRLHHRSDSSLSHLADTINSIVTGWVTYYGRFYRSRLYPSLRHINDYLLRWAMQKYKRLRNRTTRARTWLKTIAGRQPNLFVHWRLGLLP